MHACASSTPEPIRLNLCASAVYRATAATGSASRYPNLYASASARANEYSIWFWARIYSGSNM